MGKVYGGDAYNAMLGPFIQTDKGLLEWGDIKEKMVMLLRMSPHLG